MTNHRKLVGQWLCILLALPFLYAASVGPVLFLVYHLEHRNIATLHRGDTLLGGAIYWRVYGLYAPLRRAASAAALGSPLSAYLRLWRVPLVKVTVSGKTGTTQNPLPKMPATPVPGSRLP